MTSEPKLLSPQKTSPLGGSFSSSSHPLRFVFVAGGIFVCFFYYGILQEAITKGTYVNKDGDGVVVAERFTYTLSLVTVQCAVNFAYAQILLRTVQRPKSSDGHVGRSLYAVCALTYLLAMVSSNLSLQWVPYPTQVVGKSCKPIPVMLLGVLLGGKSYSLRKYLFILLIVVGVSLFLYNPKKASSSSSSVTSSSSTGELLLLMSLAMDGLTGAVQERMRGGPGGKPNSATMMKFMNLFSLGYLSVALVTTGELFSFVAFVGRFPSVLWKILSFSVTSALGQYFIFACVSEFGPLPCSVVTTTRKFFTVLASVFFFGNVLSGMQWGGAVLVFVGLSLDAVYKH